MAKSARATISKRNSATRRDTIHKPVEDERLQRLSEKLLAIAKAELPTESTNPANKKDDAMDVVEESKAGETTAAAPANGPSKKRASKGKISRPRHTRNAVVFPSLRKNLLRQGAKRKTKA